MKLNSIMNENPVAEEPRNVDSERTMEESLPPTATTLAVGGTLIEEPPSPSPPRSSLPNKTSSIEGVFAWVGFILINAAFISIISWGSFANWVIGFVVALFYVITLLVVGFWLRARNDGKDTILISLTFLLATVAMVVAGLYIPLYAFPCSANNDYYDIRGDRWVTDTQNLPSDVQSWWEASKYESSASNFIYLKSTGVLLFSGYDDRDDHGHLLYRKEDGKAPERLDDDIFSEARNFIIADDDNTTACFDTKYNHPKITCTTDGFEYATTEEVFPFLVQMYYSTQRIWLHTNRNEWPYGDLLYSVDSATLSNVTEYSTLQSGDGIDFIDDEASDYECTYERTSRIRFLSWLFLSALPAFVAALAISYFHQVATMPIGVFLSGTWMVVCAIYAVNPSFESEALYIFLQWWAAFTAGPWLVVLILAHLTNRISVSRLRWSSNFATVVYTVGVYNLFLYTGQEISPEVWQWIGITVFTVPILFLVSVITRQIFPMVVVAIVLMTDIWRLTQYIASLANSNNTVPIHAAVLGFSGIALGFLGYFVSKQQTRMESAVSNWMKSKLKRWVTNAEKDSNEGTNDTPEVADALTV